MNPAAEIGKSLWRPALGDPSGTRIEQDGALNAERTELIPDVFFGTGRKGKGYNSPGLLHGSDLANEVEIGIDDVLFQIRFTRYSAGVEPLDPRLLEPLRGKSENAPGSGQADHGGRFQQALEIEREVVFLPAKALDEPKEFPAEEWVAPPFSSIDGPGPADSGNTAQQRFVHRLGEPVDGG